MKLITKLIDFIKKVFGREQYKMIDSGEINSNKVDNKSILFREQLKINVVSKTVVESDVCVNNGLGFHRKING